MRFFLIFLIVYLFLLPTAKAQKEAIERFKKTRKKIKLEKKLPPPPEETPITKKESPKETETIEEIPIIAFEVPLTDYQETIPILGTISPFEKVELKFEKEGVVKKVYVEEGRRVKKGEVLAELDENEFILKEEYAKNKYESEENLFYSREKEYELKKRLYEKGAILKEKLEQVKFELDSQKSKMLSAQKEWELAKENLKKIKLVAPCDGIIDEKEVEEGEFVTPQDKVFTIIKVDKVYAEVGITEKEIPKIRKNLLAIINVDSYPEQQFAGKVKTIHPSLKGFSRTLTVKIELDNTQGKLLPGMFLKGDIILVSFKNVNIVPTKNILPLRPGFYVVPVVIPERTFTPQEIEEAKVTGTIELRNIQLQYRGEEYSVVTGVGKGELIVYQSSKPQIKSGEKVKIINIVTYEE